MRAEFVEIVVGRCNRLIGQLSARLKRFVAWHRIQIGGRVVGRDFRLRVAVVAQQGTAGQHNAAQPGCLHEAAPVEVDALGRGSLFRQIPFAAPFDPHSGLLLEN